MTGTVQPRLGLGRLAGRRVLIAEDSWLTADTLSVLLEAEGARVVGPSATCAGALAYLEREAVDFALVDMGLGDAFADRLAEELVARTIPFFVLTGYSALPTNADERAIKVIRKPIDKRVLIDLLSGYFGPGS